MMSVFGWNIGHGEDHGRHLGAPNHEVRGAIRTEWKIRSEADVKRHFRLFVEMLDAMIASLRG